MSYTYRCVHFSVVVAFRTIHRTLPKEIFHHCNIVHYSLFYNYMHIQYIITGFYAENNV